MSRKKIQNKKQADWHNLKNWTVRVRFRNVGQGDTLILEMEEAGILWLGIIDCKNTEEGYNAVTAYLDYLKYMEEYVFHIAFIVISHPHKDHYLGLRELLEYVGNEYILLYNYSHTMIFDNQYRTMSKDEKSQFDRIRNIANMVTKANNISGKLIGDGMPLNLTPFTPTPRITIECLSPTLNDIDRYDTNKNANHLSTVMVISNGKDCLLLTSDAPKEVFERIIRQNYPFLHKYTVAGVQVPHHGSIDNFVEEFWESLSKKEKMKTDAVISVGKDNQHGHPSAIVERKLNKMDYLVKRTDKQKRPCNDPIKLQTREDGLIEIDIIDPGDHDVFIGI